MIIAEKFYQKLNYLRSKNEIKDFFIYFDEYRNLEINLNKGSFRENKTNNGYTENSRGSYLIIWDDEYLTSGAIKSYYVEEFEEFISFAKKFKSKYSSEIFVPGKTIYPMVIAYSKSLADMIDIPEYLLKLSDLTDELDQMIKVDNSTSKIKASEGTKYAYSSKAVDEYFSYTQFEFHKNIDNTVLWRLKSSETLPIAKMEQLISFLGDLYQGIHSINPNQTKSLIAKDLILTPSLFSKLFIDQVLFNINGDNIINGKSCFTGQDFLDKKKVLGSFSMSYDPLISNKVGTYRFTSFGLKPQREYFIKYGKLESPLMNEFDFALLGFKKPSVEIQDLSNIKFEGIKKKTFDEVRKQSEKFVLCISDSAYQKNDFTRSVIYCKDAIGVAQGSFVKKAPIAFELDLINEIRNGNVELIEFTDGQLGCKISEKKIVL